MAATISVSRKRKEYARPIIVNQRWCYGLTARNIDRDDFCRTLEQAGITCRLGTYSTEAVVLPDFHGSITTIPGYAEGFFQVQDEAAQLATCLLGPFRPGAKYLDGCAGLGGKTSHLLQLAKQQSCRSMRWSRNPTGWQNLKKILPASFLEMIPHP